MSLYELTKSHALTLARTAHNNALFCHQREKDANEAAREKYIDERIGRRGIFWRKLDRAHWGHEYDITDYGYVSVNYYAQRCSRLRNLINRIQLMDGEFRIQLDTKDMSLLDQFKEVDSFDYSKTFTRG